MSDYFNNREILITGGTGSLGKALTNLLLEKYHPHGIRIFSRGEYLQWQMNKEIKSKFSNAKVSFLIGDIRDRKRIELACKGVHIIIHAAALKQVISSEYNPIETIQTNVFGSQNIVYAAIENKVEKVIGISTDKAVYPINLYGATKMCMERLFLQGNHYTAGRDPLFSICRYGNVIGSRGSVIPLFKEQAKTGMLTITEPHATRFWITLEKVAQFIVDRIEEMKGEEIFIPKISSCFIIDIARTICPNCNVETIGLSVGEKYHETLITFEEGKRAISHKDYFTITNKSIGNNIEAGGYNSLSNQQRLTSDEIKKHTGGN